MRFNKYSIRKSFCFKNTLIISLICSLLYFSSSIFLRLETIRHEGISVRVFIKHGAISGLDAKNKKVSKK